MLVPEFSYYINLGLWYFKLLLVLSFPVIGYVIRRKWLLSVAKEVEIRRLMRLAAEEAARAEYEVAEEMGCYGDARMNENGNGFGYEGKGKQVRGGSFVSCPEVDEKYDCAEVCNECAVCFSPTKTRCARCKSVWYCSAKCQFYHWRKGHRDNCCPVGKLNQTSDGESLQLPRAFDNEKAEISSPAGSIETENAFSVVGQTQLLRKKSNYGKVDAVQDVKRSNPIASFSSSVSLSSSSSGISSDSSDGSSIPESSSSSDREKTIGCEHINAFVAKSASEIKPSGVKDSKTTAHTKLHGQQTILSQCGSQRISSSSTASDLYVKGSVHSVHKSGASGFWDGSLDYGRSDTVKTKPQPTSDSLGSAGPSNCRTHLHGKVENSKTSASFRIVESWTSEVYPSVPSTKIHTQPKAVHSGFLNTTGGHKVELNSSANVVSPQSSDINKDFQNLNNLPLLSSNRTDRILHNGDHKLKPRRSSASNGDISIHNMKEDTFYQVSNLPHSWNATSSSLSSEKLQRPLNSSESDCTVKSLKCRLEGGPPLNYQVIHSSLNSRDKAASNITKISAASSNIKLTRSDQNNSPKVANSLETSACKAVDPSNVSKRSKSRCNGADESYDNKVLFSYESFKSLYGWNQVELRPRGLVNCGNSCFANAVLQCLSFTPPLTAYLLQGLHSKSCSKRAWCFTCEFEDLIRKAKDGNSPISPVKIISQLPNIGSQLSNGRQEDAHEFLRYVVDTMQSICMNQTTNVISKTVEENTLLGLTFGGYLQSKIRCVKCGGKSEHPERIMDLSVEIEGNIRSLHDALKQFTSTETLDAENKYNCARCKSYQKAKKKLTILEAPNILTIALKRFQGGKYGKLNKRVDFPEVLDMAPYMSRTSDDKAPVYKLYGVIVHLDTMNATFSGHYVCYVKNVQNKWFLVDDSVVKTVEFKTVREQSAYMLLYARCLPRAPKSLRDKSVCNSKSKDTPLLTGHSPFTSGPNSPYFDNETCSRAPCNAHHVKFELDSYSDNSSLFSSCSGYSCSTDSCTWESTSDSSSPFSSPLGSEHHHLNHHLQMEKNRGTHFFSH